MQIYVGVLTTCNQRSGLTSRTTT